MQIEWVATLALFAVEYTIDVAMNLELATRLSILKRAFFR